MPKGYFTEEYYYGYLPSDGKYHRYESERAYLEAYYEEENDIYGES